MEMPQKVFCQERVVAYPVVSGNTPSVDDKVKSVVFKYQEQLSIVDKQDIYTAVPSSRVSPYSFGITCDLQLHVRVNKTDD